MNCLRFAATGAGGGETESSLSYEIPDLVSSSGSTPQPISRLNPSTKIKHQFGIQPLGWTNLLALPRIVFSPSCAFSISLFFFARPPQNQFLRPVSHNPDLSELQIPIEISSSISIGAGPGGVGRRQAGGERRRRRVGPLLSEKREFLGVSGPDSQTNGMTLQAPPFHHHGLGPLRQERLEK